MLIYCHLCKTLYCVPATFDERDAMDHLLDLHPQQAAQAVTEGPAPFDYVVDVHPQTGDWVIVKPLLLIEPSAQEMAS